MSTLTLYHGSQYLIRQPQYGQGKPYNDYGSGFYMTEFPELAKEWACSEECDGFANQYELDMEELNCLYLTRGDYHILNWLAILLENRVFRLNSDFSGAARQYLLEHFGIPYKNYDVICGYRADDSYFSFAGLFLNNGISLEQLERAMMLGNLGEQYVLKSKKAFSKLKFTGYETAQRKIFYPQKIHRDQKAREEFQKQKKTYPEGIYMIDILREGWENDDKRLQRIISG
jgi:hypothetical protein